MSIFKRCFAPVGDLEVRDKMVHGLQTLATELVATF